MKILVGCECSGVVRDAFIARGHDAVSCDMVPSDRPGPHYLGDVRDLLSDPWDMGIFFPPCTRLAVSGALRFKGREREQEEALAFINVLLEAKIYRIALENPVGVISTRIARPSQIIQPHQFGEDASKKTCLWLKNLPLLVPTKIIPGRFVGYDKRGKPIYRWANQTDSGQNRLGPSPTRAKDRGETYQGVGDAMADQWGALEPPR